LEASAETLNSIRMSICTWCGLRNEEAASENPHCNSEVEASHKHLQAVRRHLLNLQRVMRALILL
jgi:hypothetical protein